MNQLHPTPQFMRNSYISLNGQWHYAFSHTDDLLDCLDGIINVPFSPETKLSGVKRQLMPDEYLHYERVFYVDSIDRHLLLHFGAVDQYCKVFINGQYVGDHMGGYTSFVFDISNYVISGANSLYVVVKDVSDTSYHSRGKQKLRPGGMYYTAQSGIWQDVWMEYVPLNYIKYYQVTSNIDDHCLNFKIGIAGDRDNITIKVYESNGDNLYHKVIKENTYQLDDEIVVELDDHSHLWTPENPYLYGVELIYGDDHVYSYTAMRLLTCDEHLFYLNHQPIFFNGVLDQGYWKDSLMTPPNDQAMIDDILLVKNYGYNTIRKHIKIEPMRWYYHCDRLGMIVWQDMINGGISYNDLFVTYMPTISLFTQRHTKDTSKMLHRSEIEGQREFFDEVITIVKQLYNAPCIALWTAFNEGWGQFKTKEVVDLIRSIDSTRLIDAASGWFDQGNGDLYSIHNYFRKLKVKPQNRVVALTEYGGYTYAVEGHSFTQKVYGYKSNDTLEILQQNYEKLIKRDIFPNIPKGLCAAIYTQVSDIQDEVNGLITYDRMVKKFDVDRLYDLNQLIYGYFERYHFKK